MIDTDQVFFFEHDFEPSGDRSLPYVKLESPQEFTIARPKKSLDKNMAYIIGSNKTLVKSDNGNQLTPKVQEGYSDSRMSSVKKSHHQ